MSKISTVKRGKKTLAKKASNCPRPNAAKYDVVDPVEWERLLRAATDHLPSIPAAVPLDYTGPYNDPGATIRLWILGRSKPPITKIIAAASLLSCTEQQVAMAVHGFNSQAEAVEARKTEQARRSNGARREKYAASPEVRIKNKVHNEETKEKRRAKIFAGPMFTQAWGNTASHMYKEGIITKLELLFIKTTNKQRYKRKNKKKERAAEKSRRESRPDYWLKKANRSLNILLTRTDKLRKELEGYAQRLNRPWHKAGYFTKEKWVAETPEGRRYQLEHWQAVTHRRRAKEMQAGGRGVTRDEWFAIMKKWDYHCAYCGARRYAKLPNGGKVKMTMDHVIPMPLGPDEPENILPACHSCNTSKSGNDLMVWAATKGVNVHPLAVEQYNRLLDKYTEPTHATW